MGEQCHKEGEIATLKTENKNIMKLLKEIRDDLRSFKGKCDNTYATKEEVANNNERLSRLERILDKILFISVSSAVSAIGIAITVL